MCVTPTLYRKGIYLAHLYDIFTSSAYAPHVYLIYNLYTLDWSALEDSAKEGGSRVIRTSSSAEVQYLQRLVEKHGREYEKMARDRKGNVQQYTAGQLRRAIAKAGLDVDRIIV